MSKDGNKAIECYERGLQQVLTNGCRSRIYLGTFYNSYIHMHICPRYDVVNLKYQCNLEYPIVNCGSPSFLLLDSCRNG